MYHSFPTRLIFLLGPARDRRGDKGIQSRQNPDIPRRTADRTSRSRHPSSTRRLRSEDEGPQTANGTRRHGPTGHDETGYVSRADFVVGWSSFDLVLVGKEILVLLLFCWKFCAMVPILVIF